MIPSSTCRSAVMHLPSRLGCLGLNVPGAPLDLRRSSVMRCWEPVPSWRGARAPGSQTGAGVSSHQSLLLVQHPVTQQACSAAPSLLGSVVMDSNLPSLSSPSFPLSGFKNIHLKLQYGLARAAACSDEWDDTGRTEAFGLVGAAWRRAETSSAQDWQEKAPTASLPLSSCVHGQK